MARKKAVKKKVEIVFDPLKRREFLTGFTKRKNERKKRARDQMERILKEDRKNIRQELKEGFKHMKKSFEPLRELTEADMKEDEYEDDDVKVKIVELSTSDLAKQRNFLGENRAESSSEEEQQEEESEDDDTNKPDFIPGMELHTNTKKKQNKLKTHNDAEGNDKKTTGQNKPKSIMPELNGVEIKSKKDLDRLMKTKSLKKLKQSKAFKIKEGFDKKANQKKARRDKNNMLRSIPKHMRKKKKMETSRYRKGRLVGKKQIRRQKSND